jgi:hypothetical protein
MVDQVLSVQGQRYAPVVTSPYKMLQKLAELKIYFDKQQSNAIVLDLTKQV